MRGSRLGVCAIAAVLLYGASVRGDEAALNKTEAKSAVAYLNKVRQDPASFSQEIGVDLGAVKARPVLKWSRVLAKVAEQKALDMANREYFDHVNPEGLGINIMIHEAGYKLPDYMIKNKSDNAFESIAAGFGTGVGSVKQLIVDKGTPSLGHRIHLLGMDDFHAKHTHIGIGCAKKSNSKYRSYWCFIIANTDQPIDEGDAPAEAEPSDNDRPIQPAPKPAAKMSKSAQDLVRLINEGRGERSVAAIQVEDALNRVAQKRAQSAAEKAGEFDLSAALRDAGYEYMSYSSRNGYGYEDAQAFYKVISKAQNGEAPVIFSEDFTQVGVAVVKSADGTPYYSIILAKPQE